jgi:hypothetical protein
MSKSRATAEQVAIRPGVSVLSVFRYLNYQPWFALAEFVDNAVQSSQANAEALRAAHGPNWKLKVSIKIDTSPPGQIVIRDTAAGINAADFPRAFRPAVVPLDSSGLSEFGMGMKSAACWFASLWHVRTKALGETIERTVRFNIDEIVTDELEMLDIHKVAAPKSNHYTEVVLERLHHIPVGRTIGKIKEHLTDIYRVFLRNGSLEVSFNGEPLQYEEPAVLVAPYVRDATAESRTWKKAISFRCGRGQTVKGFAALRDPGNHAKSGFALFRRGRLIQGSGEEGYRPAEIFGTGGSYRHLRLFGELHLEGFDVSHTKDGFRWDENEPRFLSLLKERLDSGELPLLHQADHHRALAARRDRAAAAVTALTRTGDVIERALPDLLPKMVAGGQGGTDQKPLPEQFTLAKREIKVNLHGQAWVVKIELTDDPAEGDWLSVGDWPSKDSGTETIEIRISMAHPFMVSFAQTKPNDIEALVRIGAALAISEKLARRAGLKLAGTVRRNLNEILRGALSEP